MLPLEEEEALSGVALEEACELLAGLLEEGVLEEGTLEEGTLEEGTLEVGTLGTSGSVILR